MACNFGSLQYVCPNLDTQVNKYVSKQLCQEFEYRKQKLDDWFFTFVCTKIVLMFEEAKNKQKRPWMANWNNESLQLQSTSSIPGLVLKRF